MKKKDKEFILGSSKYYFSFYCLRVFYFYVITYHYLRLRKMLNKKTYKHRKKSICLKPFLISVLKMGFYTIQIIMNFLLKNTISILAR